MAKDKKQEPEALPVESGATVCSHCGAAIPAFGVRFVISPQTIPHKVFCSYKCYVEDGIKTVQKRVTND